MVCRQREWGLSNSELDWAQVHTREQGYADRSKGRKFASSISLSLQWDHHLWALMREDKRKNAGRHETGSSLQCGYPGTRAQPPALPRQPVRTVTWQRSADWTLNATEGMTRGCFSSLLRRTQHKNLPQPTGDENVPQPPARMKTVAPTFWVISSRTSRRRARTRRADSRLAMRRIMRRRSAGVRSGEFGSPQYAIGRPTLRLPRGCTTSYPPLSGAAQGASCGNLVAARNSTGLASGQAAASGDTSTVTASSGQAATQCVNTRFAGSTSGLAHQKQCPWSSLPLLAPQSGWFQKGSQAWPTPRTWWQRLLLYLARNFMPGALDSEASGAIRRKVWRPQIRTLFSSVPWLRRERRNSLSAAETVSKLPFTFLSIFSWSGSSILRLRRSATGFSDEYGLSIDDKGLKRLLGLSSVFSGPSVASGHVLPGTPVVTVGAEVQALKCLRTEPALHSSTSKSTQYICYSKYGMVSKCRKGRSPWNTNSGCRDINFNARLQITANQPQSWYLLPRITRNTRF